MFSGSKENFFEKILTLFYATFQCRRYNLKELFKKIFFAHEKLKKTLNKVAHNRPKPFYYTVQPRPTAHSPNLIFHIMKSRDQRSVLLSVSFAHICIRANEMIQAKHYLKVWTKNVQNTFSCIWISIPCRNSNQPLNICNLHGFQNWIHSLSEFHHDFINLFWKTKNRNYHIMAFKDWW